MAKEDLGGCVAGSSSFFELLWRYSKGNLYEMNSTLSTMCSDPHSPSDQQITKNELSNLRYKKC